MTRKEGHALVIGQKKYYPMSIVRKLVGTDRQFTPQLLGSIIIYHEDDEYVPEHHLLNLVNQGRLVSA